MIETIKEIITWVAPLAAGFIVTTIIPALIERKTTSKLQNKIDEVHESKKLKDLEDKLDKVIEQNSKLEKEILEMRGKRK